MTTPNTPSVETRDALTAALATIRSATVETGEITLPVTEFETIVLAWRSERDTAAELRAALDQWRKWAGRHQPDLYHGLTPDGYGELNELMRASEAALLASYLAYLDATEGSEQ